MYSNRSSLRGAIPVLVVLVIAIAGAFTYVKGPAVVAAIKGDNRKVEKLQHKQEVIEEKITTKQMEIVKDAHGDVAAVNAILHSDAPAEKKVEEAKPFAQKADDKLTTVDGGLSFQERKYFQDLIVKLLSDRSDERASAKAEIAERDKKSGELNDQLSTLKADKTKIDDQLKVATNNLQASEARYRAEAERAQFWTRIVIVAGVAFLLFNYVLPAMAAHVPALAPFVELYHKLVNPILHRK